jgi:uncharacterized membrane protein YhaH (DUF805 family)
MKYYFRAFKKYAVFSGRASRSEFWFFYLFSGLAAFVIGFVCEFVGTIFGANPNVAASPADLYVLAALLPTWAVIVRRLHDIGATGWWAIVPFAAYVLWFAILLFTGLGWSFYLVVVPVILLIGLLIALATDSQPGPNRFGPNPKGVNPAIEQTGAATPTP